MQYFDRSADTVATSPRCLATTSKDNSKYYVVTRQLDAQSDYTHLQLLNKLPICSR